MVTVLKIIAFVLLGLIAALTMLAAKRKQQPRPGRKRQRHAAKVRIAPAMEQQAEAPSGASDSVPAEGRIAEAGADKYDTWIKLLESYSGSEQLILDNPAWYSVRARSAPLHQETGKFLDYCRTNGIAIVKEIQSGFQGSLWCDSSANLPVLLQQGYRVQRAVGGTLAELLSSIDMFSIICISVKDDGSQAMTHEWQEKLYYYGIRRLTREHYRHSYLNIIYKRSENEYFSLAEESSPHALARQFASGSRISSFRLPFDLSIESAGADCGNRSSIRINGEEHSGNGRGMNIVAYSLHRQEIVAAETVDTFATMYRPDTIYLCRTTSS